MKDYTQDITTYLEKEKSVIDLIDKQAINTVMNVLEKAREEGRQVFVMGNGGSAATASHYVCDFNKGISYGKYQRYRFICLNDNVPTLMAYANDISYNDIFIEQLKNFYRSGDVVLGISGSGNSENVVRAMLWAKDNNATTIAFTGYDGGKLHQIAEYKVNIPVHDMQITEDLHMMLDHCMMKILCQ
ncbi:MAG: SIS domain-containing protein [Paludibacteraceae bacterium]|nr:SIS domain-containing protein [Paludibacteraceae bacterium]